MDIIARLVRIIEAASSPANALRAAVAEIALDQQSDTCGVFLMGPEGRLVLWALAGPEFDARARDAAEGLAGAAIADLLPVLDAGPDRMMIVAPLVSGARAIGALVIERAGDRAYSGDDVSRLAAVASQIVGIIQGVRLLEMIEEIPNLAKLAPAPAPPERGERVLRGVPVSRGIAIGTAVLRKTHPRAEPRANPDAPDAHVERERLRDAIQKTRNDLTRLQAAMANEIGEDEALVFGAHLLLLSDPMVHERAAAGMLAGKPAEMAIDDAFEEVLRRLRLVSDEYIRDRIEDIEDLRNRVLGHLQGAEPTETLREQLVVSPRLNPSLVVELKLRGAFGIASEFGGATSHGVLLARALGIPAVTGVSGIASHVLPGESMIIDGDEGRVILRPSPETLDRYRTLGEAQERQRTEFLVYRDRPAVTADGIACTLLANIALGVDLELARENGAMGVGLYRTEFPFIVREGIPTRDEQVRIYAKAHQAFPEGPVTFRILDLAGDKLVPGSGIHPSPNPFHGYRSIRVLFDYPHVLRDQVRAFSIASAGRPLSILVPMVTSVEDLRRVKELVHSALAHPLAGKVHSALHFGAMIEVPGAVEMVRDLAAEVDFFSIGTNDLIQYALVVDREDPRVSGLHDEFHPAIMRMVRRVVDAAHAAGKPVTVCGEIAANPVLAMALLALGVDALSVTPRFIPELKRVLAALPLRPLIDSIHAILELSTASELEQALRAYAAPAL
jgi:phosphotransferase system enzyme I (PtsP)